MCLGETECLYTDYGCRHTTTKHTFCRALLMYKTNRFHYIGGNRSQFETETKRTQRLLFQHLGRGGGGGKNNGNKYPNLRCLGASGTRKHTNT